MQEFLESLKKGEFKIPVCTLCRNKAWPPSRHCPHCLHETSLQKVDTTGTLLEFTSSHIKGKEGIFGLVEMSGIKIVGSFDSLQLKEGMKVKMSGCGVRPDGTALFHFTKA
ncbi:MAG TPA: hypothetical protein VHL10_02235 [Nitrososphaera sp.]|nr:hypothetical protein [Nitrososphaera sp.]